MNSLLSEGSLRNKMDKSQKKNKERFYRQITDHIIIEPAIAR